MRELRMSTQFFAKQFTFTQPDGTQLEVRGWGDQYSAVFETLDGFTLTENPVTGFYEVAQIAADGRSFEPAPGPTGNVNGARAGVARGLRLPAAVARAQAQRSVSRLGLRRCDVRRLERQQQLRIARAVGGPLSAAPQRTTTGTFIGLTLLIDFPDVPATISKQEVENFCNQPGYAGFGNNGSVFDYFRDSSLGRCLYTNVVTNYYKAKQPKSYYTNEAIPQGVRAIELISEALTHWKANGLDFSTLTPDNAGNVYALNVFYAGPVVNNWGKGLWPHAWTIDPRIEVLPGRFIADYQVTALGNELSLGTFCHENGHMLCDFPDLYDYGSQSAGVGAFCLMCASLNEKNPPHISAYLKRAAGWAGPVVSLTDNLNVSLNAAGNEFGFFAKNAGEYFLVENRRKAGRDTSIPDEGLAIWHVDETGSNSNEQMTPAQHYELSLEQADGAFRLERTIEVGDDTDLYGAPANRFADNTVPNSKWWDGTASNLEIFNISAPGPAMQFRVRLQPGGGGGQDIAKQSAPGLAIPDNNPAGSSDSIRVNESGPISSLRIGFDITHGYPGDLVVTLRAPWGAEAQLHNRAVLPAGAFQRSFDQVSLPALATWRGQNVQGDWTLRVRDIAASDVGQLNRWSLDVALGGAMPSDIVLEDIAGVTIPDNSAGGVIRQLATARAAPVTGIELSVDITHPFAGDLILRLDAPNGSSVILRSREGGNSRDVRTTYTVATTPLLAGVIGASAAGTWFLKVSDVAGADVGKLNSWKLVLKTA
jgi:M6 family metalloprotease-like protein